MAIDFKEMTRKNLTPSKKEHIINTIKKCEYDNHKHSSYIIHHIIPVNQANNTRDLNIPSNLIVLCPNHAKEADNNFITKKQLKEKIKKRNEDTTRILKLILRNRKKTTSITEDIPVTDAAFGDEIRKILGIYTQWPPRDWKHNKLR